MPLQLPLPSWRCLQGGRAARTRSYSHAGALRCVLVALAFLLCPPWTQLQNGAWWSAGNSCCQQDRQTPQHPAGPPASLLSCWGGCEMGSPAWWSTMEVPWVARGIHTGGCLSPCAKGCSGCARSTAAVVQL